MRLHRFCLAATRLAAFPPHEGSLLIGGLWGLKNRIPFKGKPFAHPIRYGCFLHGAISLEIATGILSILPPILTGSPVSLIPARSVLPAMPPAAHGRRHSRDVLPQAGWGGLEMTEGKAAPPSPLRRPAEGVQGLEQAMARHAGDCDRAGGCRRIHAKRRALSHLACFLAVMPSCPILR